MRESELRDQALQNVVGNPANNYSALLNLIAQELRRSIEVGDMFTAGDLFAAAMAQDPTLDPQEKRVMGAIMRGLRRLGLIEPTGRIFSSPKRSHVGDAKEWRRVV